MLYKKVDKFLLKNVVGNEIMCTFAASKTTRSGLFV